MIIGEAPGKDENIQVSPFVGPAGELLDRIFAAVGWDTNKDWYLGNIVKCRPFSQPGSGKQNTTPTEVYRKLCRPYIEREIALIQPHTIVLLGKSAAVGILGQTVKNKYMHEIAGRVFISLEWPAITFFIMDHPADILHAQNYLEKYRELRQSTWDHVRLLKEIVAEQEMIHE
jgi:DNA polymerase